MLVLAAGVFFVSCDSTTEGGETTPTTDSTAVSTNTVNNTNTANPEQPEVPAGPSTTMQWDGTAHDWGNFKAGEIKKHKFTFTNTGDHDLIISSAKPSCGCTVPYYPTNPIPPGGKGEIEVSFDSNGKNGVQNKTITVTANTEPSVTTLTISGNVEGTAPVAQ